MAQLYGSRVYWPASQCHSVHILSVYVLNTGLLYHSYVACTMGQTFAKLQCAT